MISGHWRIVRHDVAQVHAVSQRCGLRETVRQHVPLSIISSLRLQFAIGAAPWRLEGNKAGRGDMALLGLLGMSWCPRPMALLQQCLTGRAPWY